MSAYEFKVGDKVVLVKPWASMSSVPDGGDRATIIGFHISGRVHLRWDEDEFNVRYHAVTQYHMERFALGEGPW